MASDYFALCYRIRMRALIFSLIRESIRLTHTLQVKIRQPEELENIRENPGILDGLKRSIAHFEVGKSYGSWKKHTGQKHKQNSIRRFPYDCKSIK